MIAGFIMWLLLAFCRDFMLGHKKLFETVSHKMVNLKKDAHRHGMGDDMADLLDEYIVWFSANGSSVLPPATYIRLLKDLRSVCGNNIDCEDMTDSGDKGESDVDNEDGSDEGEANEEPELVETEEVPSAGSSGGWLSWIW